MQHILLSNLVLSTHHAIEGHVKCAQSDRFPEHSYYVTNAGAAAINTAMGSSATNLTENPGYWLFRALNTENVVDFEEILFADFPDDRDVLTRLSLMETTTATSTPTWLDIPTPQAATSEAGDQPLSKHLPTINENEILQLADYDAVLDYLKTLVNEPEARRGVLSSMTETLEAAIDDPKLDAAVDVLFQNILVGLQMTKFAAPDSARRFMTYVMKNYLIKDQRGC